VWKQKNALVRSALSQAITQRVLVIPYRGLGDSLSVPSSGVFEVSTELLVIFPNGAVLIYFVAKAWNNASLGLSTSSLITPFSASLYPKIRVFTARYEFNFKYNSDHIYCCTVHSENPLIIKTNKCTNMYCIYSKTNIKTLKKLLHVSIYRLSSGSTCSSLLKYVKC
jgi:hypothetical protein